MKRFIGFLAALIAMTLIISGCGTDSMKDIETKRAEYEEQFANILVEYDGGTITQFDAMASFVSQYSTYAQYYNAYGIQMDDNVIELLKKMAMESVLQSRVLETEFDRRGMELDRTAEEIRAEVEEAYQKNFDYFMSLSTANDEEVKNAEASLSMYANGITIDSMVADTIMVEKATALMNDIKDEITDVDEETVEDAYRNTIEENKTAYEGNPSKAEKDATSEGTVLCWLPTDYKAVKHILIKPESELMNALISLRQQLKAAKTSDGSEDLETLEASIHEAETACLENVREKTDAVYERLSNGEKFEEIMAELGEDPGMKREPTLTNGYYVSEGSTTWDPYFVEGALALEKIGDYSERPVISSSGVHIIYLCGELKAGEVPYEDVKDTLYALALEDLKEQHFSEYLEKEVSKLNPVYHNENWTIV
ncbi:MAG: peptidylprolyl isomerase [Christensenellales bacterium]|nr:peptidylprolyl isomerase [Christensenellales bacterium]